MALYIKNVVPYGLINKQEVENKLKKVIDFRSDVLALVMHHSHDGVLWSSHDTVNIVIKGYVDG